MPTDQLVFLSSWASILSLVVAIISLLLVRSIKANIIRFRRKQRLQELVFTISRSHSRSPPSAELESALDSLCRNFPVFFWSKLSRRGRLTIILHQKIGSRDIAGIKEVLKDIYSYSEDI